MANDSLIPNIVVKEKIEEKVRTDNETKVVNSETKPNCIEQVNTLFKQLTQALIDTGNTNETHLPELILRDLNQICSRLDDRKYCSAYDALDTFKIMLKNYIRLLDTDSFVNVIAHHYALANNSLLRSLLAITRQYDISILVQEMTRKTQQQIFFSLFDLLNTSARIVSFLQSKSSKTTNNSDVNQTVANACGSVLYAILEILIKLRAQMTGNNLEKYQNTLFASFIIFLDEYFMIKKCSRLKELQNDRLITTMLSFICNTADQTSTIPILIYANCPQACLRWISLSYLNIDEYCSLICILHNIARHDDGVIILNKYECAKILREFKSQMLDGKLDFIIDNKIYTDMRVLYYMTLALVLDSDELRGDSVNNDIISYLLSITIAASKSWKFRYEVFHISELLIVLMKLCVNDVIIDYILRHNEILTIFCTILDKFLTIVNNKKAGDDGIGIDVLTIMALANILWSISFQNRYRNELIKNIELIKRLEKFHATGLPGKVLANSYIPHRMSSLTKVIHGIWENLSPSVKRVIKSSTSSSSNRSVQSLMISYSHANIRFCRQLYDMLIKDPTLSVWIDFNNCKSRDIWEEIAHAIEQSDCILFLMSKEYFNSKSCRQEVAYVTDTLKKTFIPIYIDADYKATGWLGIRIAGSKYIRFGKNDFMNTCKDLLSIINKHRSTTIPTHHDITQDGNN
ncbi:unnamed protein product [Rotaria sordida]|uniref:TIR domain-containing protein n=1 Tax=Rotaria sordida TaxID=392033 RepID=A0A818SYL2_9BILA|nr:unnamed protein product [Rotaria sordida]